MLLCSMWFSTIKTGRALCFHEGINPAQTEKGVGYVSLCTVTCQFSQYHVVQSLCSMRKCKNLEQVLFLRVFMKYISRSLQFNLFCKKEEFCVYISFINSGCILFLYKSAELYLNSLVHLICGRGRFLERKISCRNLCRTNMVCYMFESGNQDFC